MGRSPARTLLEHLVRQSRRTIVENCAAFGQTASRLGERVALSPRQLCRWMAGEVVSARPAMQRVAEQHWGYPLAELLAPPTPSSKARQPHVEHPDFRDSPLTEALEAAALMAAQESSQHAANAGGGVDQISIEQLQTTVLRLARRYHELAPIQLLSDARRARALAYLLLERTRRPSQTTDLYLAAGQACGLMALACFDLAIWDAAEDQARSAYTYAELVDHAGLRAWSRGTQALTAYWRGQPRRAVNLAEAGVAEAPIGAGLARLRGIEARAWSHLGNTPAVNAAIKHADHAMDQAQGDDDLLDGVGGEFGWGLSLHSACAGTALLGVGDDAGAAVRIRTALELAADDPYGNLVPERAHIDIAVAELLAGRFDAATAALDHVWAVPVPHRRHGLTGRLDSVVRALTTPRWSTARDAVEMRDRIEAFNAEATSHRALTAS